MAIKRMKLADWAKEQGLSYLTAFRYVQRNMMPDNIKIERMPSGTLFVIKEDDNAIYKKCNNHGIINCDCRDDRILKCDCTDDEEYYHHDNLHKNNDKNIHEEIIKLNKTINNMFHFMNSVIMPKIYNLEKQINVNNNKAVHSNNLKEKLVEQLNKTIPSTNSDYYNSIKEQQNKTSALIYDDKYRKNGFKRASLKENSNEPIDSKILKIKALKFIDVDPDKSGALNLISSHINANRKLLDDIEKIEVTTPSEIVHKYTVIKNVKENISKYQLIESKINRKPIETIQNTLANILLDIDKSYKKQKAEAVREMIDEDYKSILSK